MCLCTQKTSAMHFELKHTKCVFVQSTPLPKRTQCITDTHDMQGYHSASTYVLQETQLNRVSSMSEQSPRVCLSAHSVKGVTMWMVNSEQYNLGNNQSFRIIILEQQVILCTIIFFKKMYKVGFNIWYTANGQSPLKYSYYSIFAVKMKII